MSLFRFDFIKTDFGLLSGNLTKLLKQIDGSKSDDEKKIYFSKLYEIVTWATIAMDEGDYGTCLELGLDLFSFGSHHLHKIILQLITPAYNLLNRQAFSTIIKVKRYSVFFKLKSCVKIFHDFDSLNYDFAGSLGRSKKRKRSKRFNEIMFRDKNIFQSLKVVTFYFNHNILLKKVFFNTFIKVKRKKREVIDKNVLIV